MDDQRFDRLARVVGGLGSRRAILRGLVGIATLAAWGRNKSGASAQYGTLGPGDACYDDSQCSQSFADYTPYVCAENGFDYDGPLNCCTGAGGYCFSDEGCCGSSFCDANQRCSYTSYAPSFPASGGQNPGDPCQTTDQCQRPVTGAICEYTDFTGDSRCCWYEGSLCSSGAQCCGSRICWNGVCTFPGSQGRDVCTWEGCGCDPNSDFCDPGLYCCVSERGYFCATAQTCGFAACTGIGCTCVASMISQCDQGLMCCVQGDPGAPGVCLPVDQCYASGPGCTTEGCTCAVQNPYACSGDLICCGPGERDATGTCQYRWNC